MGATEEQMALVDGSRMDHISYILILFSMASLVFLFANMLIHLWDRLANPIMNGKDFSHEYTHINGHPVEDGQVQDAQEFELDGLVSDDEDDSRRMPDRRSMDSSSPDTPSTLGKNNETRAR